MSSIDEPQRSEVMGQVRGHGAGLLPALMLSSTRLLQERAGRAVRERAGGTAGGAAGGTGGGTGGGAAGGTGGGTGGGTAGSGQTLELLRN